MQKKNNGELIILGGSGYYCNVGFEEGGVMRDFLKKQGHHIDDIVILKNGTSTATQIIELKKYCLDKNIRSIYLVTDKYHRTYVSYMVKKIFGEEIVIHFVECKLGMMGRYNGMLTKAFNDQLQLIIKDRAGFTPGDHETIYDF